MLRRCVSARARSTFWCGPDADFTTARLAAEVPSVLLPYSRAKHHFLPLVLWAADVRGGKWTCSESCGMELEETKRPKPLTVGGRCRKHESPLSSLVGSHAFRSQSYCFGFSFHRSIYLSSLTRWFSGNTNIGVFLVFVPHAHIFPKRVTLQTQVSNGSII